MNKKIDLSIIAFIIVIFFVVIFCLFIDDYLDLPHIGINKSDVYEYNYGWKFKYKDLEEKNVFLPHNENVDIMDEYSYKNTFPDNFDKGNVLAFKAIMQNVKILVDDNVVLNLNNNNAKTNNSVLGTYWVFYSIPKEFLGKDFEIVLQSNYKDFSGYLSDIFLINKGQESNFLINDDYSVLITIITIFITIVNLIIVDFFTTREKKDYGVFCFGILVLNTLIWIVSESGLIIFFTNKTYLLTRLQYVSMCLLQLSIYMWLEHGIEHSFKKYTNILGILVYLNTICSLILSFYNLIENKMFLQMIHLSIIITLLVYSYVYFCEYKRNVIKNIREKILLVSIVILFTVFSLILYYKDNYVDMGYFSKIGVVSVIVIFLFSYYRNYIYSKNLYLEKKYLLKIAYKDDLTGAYNRTAFNIDVEKKLDKYIIISYDCNNLKQVNDSLGHIYGDEVIINTYKCIINSFGKYGKTYRMGGDEFITIIFDEKRDSIDLELLKDEFYEQVKMIDNYTIYDFSISIGIYIVNDGLSIEEAMKLSDKLMYKDKLKYKPEIKKN